MKKHYKNYLMIICLIVLSVLSTKVNAQHFNFEGGNPSDPVWSLYIAETTLNGTDLEAGDEIAIFDGELMVGAMVLTQVCTPENQFENVLLAFNTLASGNPGYTPGNNASFKCWDTSLGIEILDFEISFDDPYGDAWIQSVFPTNNGEYSIVSIDWVQFGNLAGTISNAANSQTIEGALVTIESTSYNATTASDGSYLIEEIEVGIYNVNVNAEDYIPEIINGVEILANETTTLDVGMNAIPGIIAGTVINSETLETISGAIITVEGTTYTAISNLSGEFIIEDVEPDTYNISASAVDYFPLTISAQTIISNQTTTVDFSLEPLIKTQAYNLVTGYQFVSSRLIMENPNMQSILTSILDNLDFVRNSEGYMLRKIGPNWVNNIGDWVTTEGYLVRMNNTDSFEITGEAIYEHTPIELISGYQIISYLSPESLDCEEVFSNILVNLDFVRNTAGAMFRKIGPNWINGIGDMQPGEGYLVKMNNADELIYSTLNYPPEPPSSPIPIDGAESQTFEVDLSWTCTDPEGDPLSYDIYLGTEAFPQQVATGQTDTTYDPGTLEYNTEYFWKIVAYDDHENNTAGPIWSFNTYQPCPGIPTVTYEGQVYYTVLNGNQCWLKENLNVGTMINASVYQADNGVIEKHCYDNDPANCNEYGGLYQWNEMMQYSTIAGVQGICPSGWHLPTDGEWTTLTDFLGGESVAGGKMKETGTTHWNPPNTGATNESGFTGIPGGLSNSVGGFSLLGIGGGWWSSSENSGSISWLRSLAYNNIELNRYCNSKMAGWSVRCLKDY